ncbi:hypothetical protein SPRG_00686 [Saprolegnia parasitica CBS 223.65]|uniref:Centrosomal protein of 44 kDa n=1 Tax=Saprolegnia parasitica (strain CBS 223.65) TaxID=695850 RepID=A0A067CVU5_SAPPC|nr:hypothetical protein SPRG_00686 [Saprolegnia parasitica CBS 223.65]KDO34623.1 hypothetical protein SPRG_00686 [Saprolegnia parasitica CBS 223.65]|eukprot:XP_012194299.1 hypothetical protein SPRG_00686 [Saprolegnia parasitica CBS 223.65]
MATGDLGNNATKVRRQLQAIQYPHDANDAAKQLARGTPVNHLRELLRILHYALLDYSRHVAQRVQAADLDLYGRTDAKFVDGVFRFAREHLGYFPSLTSAQFLSATQFRERKLIIVAEMLEHIAKIHVEGLRQQRIKQSVWVPSDKAPSGRPSRPVQSPIEMVEHRAKAPATWQSVNLGQTKPSRVVRHVASPPAYHVSPLLPAPQPEPEPEAPLIFNWQTPIDGAVYKTMDKAVLKPPPPTPYWVEAHVQQEQQSPRTYEECDDAVDELYPRELPIQPSVEHPIQPSRAPTPSVPAMQATLATLEATLCNKLDDILALVTDKFAQLDARLARLEAKVDKPDSYRSPNQELETAKALNVPRTTTAHSSVYRWPPEPAAFRKVI